MEDSLSDLFVLPDEYTVDKRKPVIQDVQILDQTYKLRVVAFHSLWAHMVWNAGKCLAQHFQEFPTLVEKKSVIEFGAASALPSLCCARLGASRVVITDYPEQILLENIDHNVKHNLTASQQASVSVMGHMWGKDCGTLIQLEPNGYQVIILSDLISNHSAHRELLQDLCVCANEDTVIWVAFSHHRPWKIAEDLHFFTLAEKDFGFQVSNCFQKQYQVMFQNDPGDELVRAIVHVRTMKKKAVIY